MRHVAVAVTASTEYDHVTALEQLRGPVTVIRRCESMAELVSVARAGLAEAVLVAAHLDQVTLSFLDALDVDSQRPVAVVALASVPAERQRLISLGVPVLSADAPGQEIADLIVESVEQTRERGTARWRDAASSDDETSAAEIDLLEQQLQDNAPGADVNPDLPVRSDRRDRSSPSSDRRRLPASQVSAAGTTALVDASDSGDGTVEPADRVSTSSSTTVTEPEPSGPGEADQKTPRGQGGGQSWRRLIRRRGQGESPVPGATGPEGDGSELTPRVTAVWGPAGSPGRTTIAVNLAVEMALDGRSTLLIDMDTYGAAAAVHLGLLEETAGIARGCHAADQGTLNATALHRAAATARVAGATVDVLTGLTRPERWPELRHSALETVLDVARQDWQEIVIDVGFCLEEDEELSFDVPAPQRNAATLVGIRAADRVLAVGVGDAVGLPRLIRGLDDLESAGTDAEIEVLINQIRADASGAAPQSQVRAVWDRFGPEREIAGFLPWDRKSLDRALLSGQVLAEAAPNSPLRKALARWSARV